VGIPNREYSKVKLRRYISHYQVQRISTISIWSTKVPFRPAANFYIWDIVVGCYSFPLLPTWGSEDIEWVGWEEEWRGRGEGDGGERMS
jgi:hypothetical protein